MVPDIYILAQLALSNTSKKKKNRKRLEIIPMLIEKYIIESLIHLVLAF